MSGPKLAALIRLVVVMGLAACGPPAAPTPALTPVTVQLSWSHQAQFAGFYAADQNGYYAAEGLAVILVQGGPNVDLLAPVLDGKAQFGEANPDALLLARTQGKSLIAIAAICRRIAGDHHGSLEITSAGLGQGTTARLSLPIADLRRQPGLIVGGEPLRPAATEQTGG